LGKLTAIWIGLSIITNSETMPIIFKNATYINWETLQFSQTNVMVDEGIDASIHFYNGIEEILDKGKNTIIDCKGKYVTKSFVVGHHHAYSALATGMPEPKQVPVNFLEILKFIWWKLDKALDKDMIEASALATAIACAKAGATFVIDHHSSPNFIEGSLEIIAKAFEKVGINHLLCYEITDRDGLDKAESGLIETGNYLKKHQGLVGLHASFTVGEKTMQKAADLMNKYQSGIHIHAAEDNYDQEECQRKYGKRIMKRLNDFGFLESSKTLLAHCLHLSDGERNIINSSEAWVVQNTESNLNNKVGHFNSKSLGNRLMLGTDGMHSDMIRSAHWAHFSGLEFDKTGFGDIYFRLRNVHNYIKTNNFNGDGDNNLVIFDYPSVTPLNSDNILGHFLFGMNSGHIQHVIANGRLIVKDRRIQNVDEQIILKFTREQAIRIWKRIAY
jgi:cytosine/adenosine deaminase-related metal-dependent hydrolase